MRRQEFNSIKISDGCRALSFLCHFFLLLKYQQEIQRKMMNSNNAHYVRYRFIRVRPLTQCDGNGSGGFANDVSSAGFRSLKDYLYTNILHSVLYFIL